MAVPLGPGQVGGEAGDGAVEALPDHLAGAAFIRGTGGHVVVIAQLDGAGAWCIEQDLTTSA